MWRGKFGKYELTMDDEDRDTLLERFNLKEVYREGDRYKITALCICGRYRNNLYSRGNIQIECGVCPARIGKSLGCIEILEQYKSPVSIGQLHISWYKQNNKKARAFITAVRNDLLNMERV